MTFTPEEIIAMAKEAGFGNYAYEAASTFGRFATLVAEKAAAQEREACAQVCDAKAHAVRLWCNESNVIACAAAIRARGTKEGA